MAKLLDAEVSGGVLERHWAHSDGDKQLYTVERIQDVEPILKRNKEEFNSASKGYGKSEMQKVASIPAVVLENMAKLHNIPFGELVLGRSDQAKKIWNELLNGRDFQALRTKPGFIKV